MSLKHSILALLSSNEPKTGYQLSKEVKGSTGFFWNATHQQIYRDLASLEESKWVRHADVTQKEKPDKKVYSITKSGTKELLRWMKEPSELPPTRDTFMIKLFVGHLIEPAAILKDLAQQKQLREAQQEQYRAIEEQYFQNPSAVPVEQQYMYMTLRRGVLLGKAWLAWCEEVEDFLKRSEKK